MHNANKFEHAHHSWTWVIRSTTSVKRITHGLEWNCWRRWACSESMSCDNVTGAWQTSDSFVTFLIVLYLWLLLLTTYIPVHSLTFTHQCSGRTIVSKVPHELNIATNIHCDASHEWNIDRRMSDGHNPDHVHDWNYHNDGNL